MKPLRAFVQLALLALLSATLPARAEDYPYQSCFQIASRMHDVPLEVLLAVAATESNWDAGARSHANAHGIMQIQWPGTARHLGVQRVSELYNPCLNIELGARYLRELLDRNDGDVTRALASYNYGPTRIGRIDADAALPAGALRYVATVDGHRARIERSAGLPERSAESLAGTLRFDEGFRAERYAAALNARIDGAEFLVAPGDAGGHVVRMQPRAAGLTLADVTLLEVLGWPGSQDEAHNGGPGR